MFSLDELCSPDCIDSTRNFYKLSATFCVSVAVKVFENFSRVNFARQILMKLLIINFPRYLYWNFL